MKPGSSRFSRPTTAKKPQKVSVPTLQGENINEIIQELLAKQKEYEKKGKYVEAESFKRKIKILKQQAEKGELVEMRGRHSREKNQIQEAHLEEFNVFNIEWDQKLQDLNQQIKRMEAELQEKHEEQIQNIQEQMMEQKPIKFKQSAQLLNLRKIQQQLAKQQNYMEARQVQKRAQKLQKEQLDKWKNNQSSKFKNTLNVLRQKHENELKVMRQRIELSIEEKHRQRMQEQQKLMLKYQNVLKQLQFQQKQELLRFEKSNKLAAMQKKTKIGMFSTSKMSLN